MEPRKILDIRLPSAKEVFRKDVEAVALYRLSLQERGGYGPDARGRMAEGETPRVTPSDIQTALRENAKALREFGASGSYFVGFGLPDIETALEKAGFKRERRGSGLYYSL